MIPNCYFCNKSLEKFRDPDKTGNYTHHYCCYNCPDVVGGVKLPIWKRSCTITTDWDNEQCMTTSYLYISNIEVWVNTFYWQEGPFTDIKDKHGRYIMRIKIALNIFNIPIDILENKVKTWILFS